jgi:hypothetical protein
MRDWSVKCHPLGYGLWLLKARWPISKGTNQMTARTRPINSSFLRLQRSLIRSDTEIIKRGNDQLVRR